MSATKFSTTLPSLYKLPIANDPQIIICSKATLSMPEPMHSVTHSEHEIKLYHSIFIYYRAEMLFGAFFCFFAAYIFLSARSIVFSAVKFPVAHIVSYPQETCTRGTNLASLQSNSEILSINFSCISGQITANSSPAQPEHVFLCKNGF